MKYTEMITLEKLLRTYIEEDISGDVGNVKLNDKIITNMAIIANRSLSDGQGIEDLIRRELLKETMEFIDNNIDSLALDHSKLKSNTRQKIREQI